MSKCLFGFLFQKRRLECVVVVCLGARVWMGGMCGVCLGHI